MQGNGAQTGPAHDEVERAIRSVPGVAEARVARASETSRGRLRIRLHPGEDAERVSWSVAATLRERFGIVLDPDEIRPRVAESSPQQAEGAVVGEAGRPGAASTSPPGEVEEATLDQRAAGERDEPSAPPVGDPATAGDHAASERTAGPRSATGATRPADVGLADDPVALIDPVGASPDARGWRPVIRDLSSRNDGVAVTVTARLALEGRDASGQASSAPTTRGLRLAIAEATVRALGGFTESLLRAQVDRVTVASSDPASVSVVVSLLSRRGEELLLGASIVRDDVEHAIMRATLDALNRRIEPDLVG